jgi:hypothetical protein
MTSAFEETTFSFSDKAPPPPGERRQQTRHLTILRVGTLIAQGARELCLIRNISAGGLMAHVYSAYETDQRVAVELKTNQQIPGIVTWSDGSNIGVTFDEPIDVEELLTIEPVLDNGWKTRLPRVEVDRLATLRVGATTYWVNTRDISQGGVKVESDQPLEAGAEVVISLEGFRPIAGAVRWYQDGLAGIAFNQVIPFRELMGWLRTK